MENGPLIELEPNQWHKHNFIKIFFRINLEVLLAIYLKLNGSLKVNAENWYRYSNSKELFDLVYPLMSAVTDFTRNAIAFSEPIEWLGMEMRTGKCEIYIALPLDSHDNLRVINEELGITQHATRCFIAMLNHMLFKHLYKKPFMILREIKGQGSTWVALNDDLDYFIADKPFFTSS